MHFTISSAYRLNLGQSKILLSGNGLNLKGKGHTTMPECLFPVWRLFLGHIFSFCRLAMQWHFWSGDYQRFIWRWCWQCIGTQDGWFRFIFYEIFSKKQSKRYNRTNGNNSCQAYTSKFKLVNFCGRFFRWTFWYQVQLNMARIFLEYHRFVLGGTVRYVRINETVSSFGFLWNSNMFPLYFVQWKVIWLVQDLWQETNRNLIVMYDTFKRNDKQIKDRLHLV